MGYYFVVIGSIFSLIGFWYLLGRSAMTVPTAIGVSPASVEI
ncbi:MAG: hypothetical protein ACI9HK_001158 [Pirellulaceae bacterium]|jgi:hypothetical protein